MKQFVSPMVRRDLIDNVVVLDFQGPKLVNEKEMDRFARWLHQEHAQGRLSQVVVDFQSVRAMVTTTWGVIVRLHEMVRKTGGRVVFCGFEDRLRSTLEILHLHNVLTICPNREQALQHLGVSPPTECFA